jgi:hypothetical protein
MGDFRLEVDATGGHGCDRDAHEGEIVRACGRQGCPDCEFRRFLAQPTVIGTLRSAKLVHWPGQTCEVVDEYRPVYYVGSSSPYIEARRVKGSFKAPPAPAPSPEVPPPDVIAEPVSAQPLETAPTDPSPALLAEAAPAAAPALNGDETGNSAPGVAIVIADAALPAPEEPKPSP